MRVLLLAALLLASPALAQEIDLSSGGPVEVTARGGFEWREREQLVIATGEARAVRGGVTVIADRLVARYRKKTGSAPAAAGDTTGGTEVYRLEAEGHVRIFTATDEAVGDRGVYDIDQAVMVLTGQGLKLTTPTQQITARDSLEYWSQKHMAVGRGNAVVLTSDARRVAADVLVAYTAEDNAPKPAPKPATTNAAGLPGSGKLQRLEAYGNVEVRTATDTVRGGRALYLPETEIARVLDQVRITRGEYQMNGAAADVNMKTGIARLVANPGSRVQGLIVPGEKPPGLTPVPPKP
jgi:lipopolysaccharide export system protein LptA